MVYYLSNSVRLGFPTARDEEDVVVINADGSINVQTQIQALTGVEPEQVLVGTEATVLVAENTSRRNVDIFNNGNTTVYLGLSSDVTINTGMPMLPRTGKIITGYTGDIYGISTVDDVDLRIMEMTG